MKILLIHSKYIQAGGEDSVVQQELDLLSKYYEVDTLFFQNKGGIQGAFQFLFSIWNVYSARVLKKKIKCFQPDIIHIHNWHFATGPIIIRTAKKLGIPIVVTLHNYRLLCPSATFLYGGKLHTSSLYSRFPWIAVKNKAYRNSSLQTFWLAFVIWFHKYIGTWRMVNRYFVLTDFARALYINSTFGVLPEKFIVKPNFVIDPSKSTGIRGDSFLFIGRLSSEKGIDTLLEAFRCTGLSLRIAGSGPLEDKVMQASRDSDTIHYLGELDKSAIQRELIYSTALVFPSIWYEGMPMTILESFVSGTPVIASNLGAMAKMISAGYNGLLFNVGSTSDLSQTLQQWHRLSKSVKYIFQQNARATYEALYTPEVNVKQLLSIYKEIIDEKTSS